MAQKLSVVGLLKSMMAVHAVELELELVGGVERGL
jgi:hypothetical protein